MRVLRRTRPSQLSLGVLRVGAATLALATLGATLAGGCGSDVESSDPDPCDVDCDDRNPCTINSCEEGRCVATPVPDGTSCSDGDACNGVEVCTAGACAGEPLVVNDGDVCTVDACDPATGEITHGRSPGCFTWASLPSEGAPTARTLHTAVWTGSEMIVWGGLVEDEPSVTNTGAAYHPATDSWRPLSTAGAPAGRHSHVAFWTGDRMLVWGGYGASSYLDTGGLYDPVSDSWSAISAVGAPSGRTAFGAAWTGSELVVHGGIGPQVLSDGGTYSLASNTWTALPATGLGGRYSHSATAAGPRVIIWGGNNLYDWLRDGAMFLGGSFSPTATEGAPGYRQEHSATWTGTRLLIWGGWNGGVRLNDGASFDPEAGAAGAWAPMTSSAAPSPRAGHVALWTGTDLFIWGGCGGDSCFELRSDGALYRPSGSGGTWYPIPSSTQVPGRTGAAGVWAGDRVIVWGGQGSSGLRGDGAHAAIVALP